MKIIEPGYEILTNISDGATEELKFIERVGRICYKSENRITDTSAPMFVKGLIEHGHGAMIEHSQLSVKFIVNRGVSHELVRHRIASWAQSSTRYCNYSLGKFGHELTFIKPCVYEENSEEYKMWEELMQQIEDTYLKMTEDHDVSPQDAREILPNSLMTEVVMTANYREWRNFFKLRCDNAAHPEMRRVTIPLLEELKERIPVVFDDITY